jgi:dolichol-phosphate mannosyltransferase
VPRISVVSPVYRARECLDELYRRIAGAVGGIDPDFEIVLVEDHGNDGSWEKIVELSRADPRVRGVKLSRNFGQHRACTAGLDLAAGDWVVLMDCDLQDPPEAIPQLYARAMEGYDIVTASFTSRAETRGRQILSRRFWKLLSWLAGIEFDPQVGNFRILSRRVVESFRGYREQFRYTGAILNLVGFRSTSVPVPRAERYAGRSSYNFGMLIAVATDIVLAYSDKPLKVSVMVGLAMAALSFATGLVVLVLGATGHVTVSGWTSVMVSIYFIGGLIIANLGVIGSYLGRTYDEVKKRPLYVIETTTVVASAISEEAPAARVARL